MESHDPRAPGVDAGLQDTGPPARNAFNLGPFVTNFCGILIDIDAGRR